MKRRVHRVIANGIPVKVVSVGQCQYVFSDACTLEGLLAAELRLCHPLRPVQLLDLADRRSAVELELSRDRRDELIDEGVGFAFGPRPCRDTERRDIVLRILEAVS